MTSNKCKIPMGKCGCYTITRQMIPLVLACLITTEKQVPHNFFKIVS